MLLGRVIAYGVSNFRRSGFLGVVITKEKWKFAKRCSLRRLNVIQTKRNLLRPLSGLNRYPRLVQGLDWERILVKILQIFSYMSPLVVNPLQDAQFFEPTMRPSCLGTTRYLLRAGPPGLPARKYRVL